MIQYGGIYQFLSDAFLTVAIMNPTNKKPLSEGFCILFFRPRTRPNTSLQRFALQQRESKAKHCRNVLGRVLGRKN